MALDGLGNLYVTDLGNGRVVRFSGVALPNPAQSSSSVPLSPPSSSSTGGRAVGDPVFVGFLGQVYQVHGMDGAVYCLLSQASVSINALFVFLESGACPVVNGVAGTNCWSHPDSYFASLAQQTAQGDQLEVIVGPATAGFRAVRFDGEAVMAVEGVEGACANLSFHITSSLSFHAPSLEMAVVVTM